MVKTILGEAFEELKQIPKQIAGQAVKLPAEVGKQALEQVTKGGKKVDTLTGIEIPSPAKVKKLKKKEEKRKVAGIAQAQQVIATAKPPPSASRRTEEQIPAYIAGKPKKELPPPVSASKPKMGTAERKLGISG